VPLAPALRIRTLEDLQELAALGRAQLYPDDPRITVGTAACSRRAGALEILRAVRDEVDRLQLGWTVAQTGCIGWCSQEPLLDVWVPGRARITYGRVTAARARQIVRAIPNPLPALALAYLPGDDNVLTAAYTHYDATQLGGIAGLLPYKELPRFRGQLRIAMRNCGLLDPESLSEYAARGGYSALWHVLRMQTPEQLLEQLRASGLRERNDLASCIWARWKRLREAAATPKVLFCRTEENGSAPSADTWLLESDPHSVLEGIIIGAYATGARQGIIHVPATQPLAAEMISTALRAAKSAGLLGGNILDSGFAFDVRIVRGPTPAGCREESAAIHALEEMLQPLEPVPASSAARPACLSNAETWANIPVIARRGGAWFAHIGTAHSSGTKIFMLTGAVNDAGPAELPLGVSIAHLVEQTAGGLTPGRECKGVQTGGVSGGFIPVDRFELPADYETLAAAGSMLGSGELAVLNDHTCVVESAYSAVALLQGKSCGRCIPCRLGTQRLLQLLDQIRSGQGKEQTIELLEDLAWLLKDTSGCERGREVGDLVLSSLRYFRDEYLAHARDARCPARACRALISFMVDAMLCDGCGACLPVCASDAVVGEPGRAHLIAQTRCNKCGACREVCASDAVVVM